LSEILPFLACYALARRGQLERIEYGIYRVPLISPSRLDQHACSAVGRDGRGRTGDQLRSPGPRGVRLVAAVAHLPGQVAGADGSGVAAGIVVSVRDQEDRMALRVVVEARVRFRLPGEHGIHAKHLGILVRSIDRDLGYPARLGGDGSATASISSASSVPYWVLIVLSG